MIRERWVGNETRSMSFVFLASHAVRSQAVNQRNGGMETGIPPVLGFIPTPKYTYHGIPLRGQ